MIRLLILVFSVSAYCNDSCGKPPGHAAYGVMANGKATHQGAIACPSWMPLGTEVYLPIGKFICEDRGEAIMKNRLDVWFPTCEEALEWGRQKMKAKIMLRLDGRI